MTSNRLGWAERQSKYGFTPYSTFWVQHGTTENKLECLWRHQMSSNWTRTEQVLILDVFRVLMQSYYFYFSIFAVLFESATTAI